MRGVQPLSMLWGVYNHYPCYDGCTTFIHVIRHVNNLYQYYQGCTTFHQCYQGCKSFINVIRGVNNLYQCLSVCTNTFTNIIRDDKLRWSSPTRWQITSATRGGHCLPHIPLIKVITNLCAIEISNKHDITHPCNYILILLHTPGVNNKSHILEVVNCQRMWPIREYELSKDVNYQRMWPVTEDMNSPVI